MAHRNQYLVTLSGPNTLQMPTGGRNRTKMLPHSKEKKEAEEKEVYESVMRFYDVARGNLCGETSEACEDERKQEIALVGSTVDQDKFVARVIEGIFISFDSRLEDDMRGLGRYVKGAITDLGQEKTFLDMANKYYEYKTSWKNKQAKRLVDIVFDGLVGKYDNL